ncbi:MAG: hypothetical protein HUK05_02615 [Prevotella sp.]|nr:hypothetical protein [Prevotella sp.]
MRKTFIFLIVAFACAVSCTNKANGGSGSEADTVSAVVAQVDTFSYKGYTILANILAGKEIQDKSVLANVSSTQAYTEHQEELTELWAQYKASDINAIREWAKENIMEVVDTVFYPFGGPDFNYLASFFPDCRYSLLVGMEKGGLLPFSDKESQKDCADILTALRESISSNIHSSFFVTRDMRTDLNNEYIKGTVPVVMMFVALHGFDVITVNPVHLDVDGDICYTDSANVFAHTLDKDYEEGFEIMYRKPDEKGIRRVVYLSSDLSNEGFNKSGLAAVVNKTFKGKTTFLKAASYCPHEPMFSSIQKAILDNSNMIISGPSGMPYTAISPTVWNIKLYGNYVGPIQAFLAYPQMELKKKYEKGETTPIKFRFGYGRSSSFFMAVRK